VKRVKRGEWGGVFCESRSRHIRIFRKEKGGRRRRGSALGLSFLFSMGIWECKGVWERVADRERERTGGTKKEKYPKTSKALTQKVRGRGGEGSAGELRAGKREEHIPGVCDGSEQEG